MKCDELLIGIGVVQARRPEGQSTKVIIAVYEKLAPVSWLGMYPKFYVDESVKDCQLRNDKAR
jgi:hypothetical protein